MTRNVLWAIVTLLVGLSIGWLIGSRQKVEIVESVRYVERPATRIDFDMPTPIMVERIDLPSIQYHDTITITERIPADTADIIADYLKRREYEIDFSTDSTGIFKVQAVVYCNRLASASATIQPMQREIERVAEVQPRKFRPYIGGGVGIGSQFSASVEVGALLKNHHLPRVGYQRIGNGNYITIGYGYAF